MVGVLIWKVRRKKKIRGGGSGSTYSAEMEADSRAFVLRKAELGGERRRRKGAVEGWDGRFEVEGGYGV